MKQIKCKGMGDIGRYNGFNYFIIPKIYNLATYAQLFKNFQDAFGEMKNQTIHVFAGFEWDKLKMIEYCTVKQFTNMDDDEEGCEELSHFHYIQWFLYYLQSQEFAKNNRIIFHCNGCYMKLKHGLSKYLFIQSNSTPLLFKYKTKIKLDTNEYDTFWFYYQKNIRVAFLAVKTVKDSDVITRWNIQIFNT